MPSAGLKLESLADLSRRKMPELTDSRPVRS